MPCGIQRDCTRGVTKLVPPAFAYGDEQDSVFPQSKDYASITARGKQNTGTTKGEPGALIIVLATDYETIRLSSSQTID